MSSRSFAALFLLVACGLSGCSTMNWGAAQEAPPSGPVAQCTIDLRPSGGKPQVSNFNMTEQMSVQQVLEKSGARRKFSNSNVELYRKTEKGEWHKMSVKVEGKKPIDPEFDYHVRPGDRLVVNEDSSSMFDSMLNTASSGLVGGKKKR